MSTELIKEEEKNYIFLVEVLFEKLTTVNNGTEDIRHEPQITLETWQFSGPDEEIVRSDAKAFMANILVEGLSAQGGPVVKSIIPPSCIKQIGLIDYQIAISPEDT